MKKWSFTTLLIIVLTLMPISQIEWNTEAEASPAVKANNQVISNIAAPNKAVKKKLLYRIQGFCQK